MILTNLNAVSRYERMRRRMRPIVADVEDPGNSEPSETVSDEDGSRGLHVDEERRPGEAARRRYRRRRELLAPERRRWSRKNGHDTGRELGQLVDIDA